MRKKQSGSARSEIRPVGGSRTLFIRSRRIVLISFLVLMLLGSGFLGFFLGHARSAKAVEEAPPAVTTAFADQLVEQENRCAAVEQINIQQELDHARDEAFALSESLDQQQEKFEQQQEEIDSLEENILNALMANLSEKSISRSNPTVAGYVEEAKELISLRRKADAFEKTPEAERINLTDYSQAIDYRLSRIPTLKPIPGRLSGYGYRIHPVFGYRHFHPAVDMGAAIGTPIKASAAGTVIAATYNSRSGRYIKINHGNGFVTAYLHCSKLYVGVGERVSKGEVIAAVGNTGTSTTPHLHFEIEFYGSPVNPNLIIME